MNSLKLIIFVSKLYLIAFFFVPSEDTWPASTHRVVPGATSAYGMVHASTPLAGSIPPPLMTPAAGRYDENADAAYTMGIPQPSYAYMQPNAAQVRTLSIAMFVCYKVCL